MILSDNLFFAQGLHEQLQSATHSAGQSCTVFCSQVRDPERYDVAVLDDFGKVVSLEEKPVENFETGIRKAVAWYLNHFIGESQMDMNRANKG